MYYKVKSTKLRDLITLKTLYKKSDEDHCINSAKLNEYLKPYDLECTPRVLRTTVKTFREYGLDIRTKGGGKKCGIWLGSHPLEASKLNKIIFAVATNPHLSKEQATEILSYLKPLVTEYQEENLVAITDTNPDLNGNNELYDVYCTISEAINKKRRVRFFTQHMRYRKETQTIAIRLSKGVLFTPKWLYQSNGEIYMIGYNNTGEREQAVNISTITSIKTAPKIQREITENSLKYLDGSRPEGFIPEEKETIIYTGPIEFFCKDRYIEELYNRFGPPCKPVAVNSRHKATYSVSEAVITTNTLFWLSGIEEYGIRLKGPDILIKSVQEYYSNLSSTMTKAIIVSNCLS